jgi:gamma-glutamyltranspeptidase/glutathione hydrolase
MASLRLLVVLLFSFFCSYHAHASAGDQDAAVAGIATAHPLATAAGFEVLEQGGNAFDAAVAISATIAVVEPMGSGFGGGGFWLLHREADGLQVMLDGREAAPAAATSTMYLDEQGNVIKGLSLNGALAAAIPGMPAALSHLASRYGRLPLRESLKPAIRAAEQGFAVYPRYNKLLEFRKPHLNAEARRIFLAPGGDLPALGTLIRQPELASTLRRLAIGGRDGFYRGETAELLLSAVRDANGIWTQQDLDNYRVIERKPVTGNYRGARIVSSSLPSSGGIVLVTMLNILSGYDLDAMPAVQRKQKIIEAMRMAYKDRADFLGDADYVPVDQEYLLSMEHADKLRSLISDRATPSDFIADEHYPKGEDTTHFSVIDQEGNRVAATLSINYPFGSGLVAAGTGVILNDEMDDFSASPGVENNYGLIGSHANAIEPGKRPLSSMTPTFVERGNEVLVIGTPGGSRIITMVLLAILEHLHDRGDVSDWVATGRYHHQYYPDVVQFEPGALTDAEQKKLTALGYELKQRSSSYGNMHAVYQDGTHRGLRAASDPRWLGHAEVRALAGGQAPQSETGTTR